MPSHVGCAIKVQVLRHVARGRDTARGRGGEPAVRTELDLIPERWAGRGLLGCHMAPKL